MRKIILIFTFSCSLISCGQKTAERIEENVTDGNGKVISREIIDSKKGGKRTAERTVELFYGNLNDIKAIDSLMSFRFYQIIPYFKFKELLVEKNKVSGELLEKTLVNSKKSEDNNSVVFSYRVKYQNIETTENIGLIRENENNDFQVYIYNSKAIEK
ncbi:hypothetical protein HUK80_17710 [Flavobacterium sp. MAH-1]|uniref:Lipoprotein n=1 Tax=Flavobacterium agri TaxID=2743471 RepID=A0A7Y9C8T5_9FLAO|nr:hypothetical protein [Flavobacterium agri]NUY82744.1 hypothetical protein [Flavobacterium agri]NYA72767.1 hypothetical protein [Flavobacterium agri]